MGAVRSPRFTIRLAAAVWAMCMFLHHVAAAPAPRPAIRITPELQTALAHAEDALLALVRLDTSSWDGGLAELAGLLVRLYRLAGDADSVVRVQARLSTSSYRHDVIDAAVWTRSDLDSRLRDLARAKDLNREDRVIGQWIDVQIDFGSLAAASVAVDRLRSAGARRSAWHRLAVAHHRRGEPEQAGAAVMKAIGAASERDDAGRWFRPAFDLVAMARAFLDEDYDVAARHAYDAARRALDQGADSVTLEWLEEVAVRLDPARGTADADLQVKRLLHAARARVRTHDVAGARETLVLARQAVEQVDRHRLFFLADIAKIEFEAGLQDDAELSLARAVVLNDFVPSNLDRDRLWWVLADVSASQHQFDRARSLVRRIRDLENRPRAWKAVAYRQALAGTAAGALSWAETLGTSEERASAFLGIALGIAEFQRASGVGYRLPSSRHAAR